MKCCSVKGWCLTAAFEFKSVILQNLKDKDVGAALERLKEQLADDIKLLLLWDKYKALPLLCPNWSDILQTDTVWQTLTDDRIDPQNWEDEDGHLKGDSREIGCAQ